MTKYLLLRDNKQTGPYDLDELKAKGLKAYDLVWIDGKSAAWRYPSEVDDLKSFAPAVEEQPFDRFYKKPSPNSQPSVLQARQAAEQASALQSKQASEYSTAPRQMSVHEQAAVLQSRQVAEPVSAHEGHASEQAAAFQQRPSSEPSFAPVVNLSFSNRNTNYSEGNAPVGEPSAVPGKRIIYVTLPAGKGTANGKEPISRSSLYVHPTQSQQVHPTQSQPLPEMKPQNVATPVQPIAMPSEEKFSHMEDDMWKGVVEMAPRPKKAGLKRIVQPLGVFLCILALLAAGIFIGLSINKDSFGFSQKLASGDASSISTPPAQRAEVPTSKMPVYNTSAVVNQQAADTVFRSDNNAAHGSPLSGNPIITQPVNTNSAIPAPPLQKKKLSTQKEKAAPFQAKDLASTPPKDSAAIGFQAIRREAVHRSDPTPDKDVLKNNIASQVSAGSGKYTVGTFGGISDVQITVSNRSIYPLDLVVVEVRYIQANKKVFKTENLYFRDVAAGAALMQEAPKSSRGIKIDYKITLINSKELGLSYSGI
ncbi:MAG TPA: hypothetical protein VK563_14975 [Puia sp.]|nr:hypothetical protein [Puia sp.]